MNASKMAEILGFITAFICLAGVFLPNTFYLSSKFRPIAHAMAITIVCIGLIFYLAIDRRIAIMIPFVAAGMILETIVWFYLRNSLVNRK